MTRRVLYVFGILVPFLTTQLNALSAPSQIAFFNQYPLPMTRAMSQAEQTNDFQLDGHSVKVVWMPGHHSPKIWAKSESASNWEEVVLSDVGLPTGTKASDGLRRSKGDDLQLVRRSGGGLVLSLVRPEGQALNGGGRLLDLARSLGPMTRRNWRLMIQSIPINPRSFMRSNAPSLWWYQTNRMKLIPKHAVMPKNPKTMKWVAPLIVPVPVLVSLLDSKEANTVSPVSSRPRAVMSSADFKARVDELLSQTPSRETLKSLLFWLVFEGTVIPEAEMGPYVQETIHRFFESLNSDKALLGHLESIVNDLGLWHQAWTSRQVVLMVSLLNELEALFKSQGQAEELRDKLLFPLINGSLSADESFVTEVMARFSESHPELLQAQPFFDYFLDYAMKSQDPAVAQRMLTMVNGFYSLDKMSDAWIKDLFASLLENPHHPAYDVWREPLRGFLTTYFDAKPSKTDLKKTPFKLMALLWVHPDNAELLALVKETLAEVSSEVREELVATNAVWLLKENLWHKLPFSDWMNDDLRSGQTNKVQQAVIAQSIVAMLQEGVTLDEASKELLSYVFLPLEEQLSKQESWDCFHSHSKLILSWLEALGKQDSYEEFRSHVETAQDHEAGSAQAANSEFDFVLQLLRAA